MVVAIYWGYTDYPIADDRIFSFEGRINANLGNPIICLLEDRTNKLGALYFGRISYNDISIKMGEDYGTS